MAGLRKSFGNDGATLRTRAPGYVLDVEEGSLDLNRFTQLRAAAHESPDPERRADLLHTALTLWRDEPLPELRTEPFSTTAVAQLEQLRIGALEERIDADLAVGRDAALVPELEALVAEYPYRERIRAQLMLALYRSGRQADALDTYQAGRRVLQDELGLEPSKDLRDLEAAILRQDEALSPARPVPAADPDAPPSTHRLSRRAVIAAGVAAFATVALGAGVVVLRSDEASGRISPGSVGVVDPVAGRVVAEVPVGFRSSLIAAGEGSVWVVDREGKTLTRIDPETNAAVSAPQAIRGAGIPIGLAVGEGSVWIAMNEGRFLSVLEVGPDLGNTRRRIPLAERDSLFSLSLDPVKLAVGDGAVWALERGQGELTRIAQATGKPKLLRDDVGASSSIAVDRDTVWLGGPDGVRKLDARTGFELEEPSGLPEEVHSSPTTSIAVGRDAVWFVGESSARLWRIRPATVTIHDSIEIGKSPSAVAVGDDGAVWVASSALDSLSRYDPETGGVDEVELGTTSRGLVARFGRIWTSPGTTGG